MTRTAGLALLAISPALAWLLGFAFAQPPGSPPQDPMAGARIFSGKGCAACHAPTRAGPAVAPDLRRIASPRSLGDLASAMWNHRPQAQYPLLQASRLDAREAGDLVAYLFTLDYFEAKGDPRAGQRLFIDKRCVICHQAGGTGGVLGPSLEHFKAYASVMLVAAVMWNHGPQMAQAMRARGIERPTLAGVEVGNLVAYLNAESSATLVGPVHLFPGDADLGRQLFVEKRCSECHGGGEPGPDLARRRTHRNFAEFAAVMWNKAPAMMVAVKRRASGIAPLRADEMADLVAYLDAIGYFAYPGNSERGQKLAMTKGCRICHSAFGPGPILPEEISRPERFGSPPVVVALAWNHSIIVERAGGRAKAAWRPLNAEEMTDLIAFVRASSGPQMRHRKVPEPIQAP